MPIGFVIIAVLLVVFYAVRKPASSAPSTSSTSAAPPATTQVTVQPAAPYSTYSVAACALDCNSPIVKDSVAKYYDTAGGWRNVYTMRPTNSVQVDGTHCDIKYFYYPVGSDTPTGMNKRRFTFQTDIGPPCATYVSDMGDPMSGELA